MFKKVLSYAALLVGAAIAFTACKKEEQESTSSKSNVVISGQSPAPIA